MINCLHQKGFTLVELIMAVVIIGILSASALPKFFSLSEYQERMFFDDLLHAIRYARKQAVATGCNVQVNIAVNQFELKRPANRGLCRSTSAPDFTLAMTRPGTGEPFYTGSLSGISLNSTAFYFSALGVASSAQVINFSNGKKISVVRVTGFAYDSSP